MLGWDEAHDALVSHRSAVSVEHEKKTMSDGEAMLDLIDKVDCNGKYFYCSIPTATFPDKLKVAKYLSSKENDIEKLIWPGTFACVAFILSKASFIDANGGQVVTPKLVLINQAGESVSVLARIFISEFMSLCQGIGLPPWEEPIVLSAKLIKGNGTNRYYGIHLP